MYKLIAHFADGHSAAIGGEMPNLATAKFWLRDREAEEARYQDGTRYEIQPL
ncbi:hypothetical protein [uncultured Gordonia sp.]|uniref:hypothetical protein n=1 Tax=uncultured Gordonia sp. TaxID=198437 RepID=UPI0025895767|nr:hypothetical protein [uncultured Gordonia sp.]